MTKDKAAIKKKKDEWDGMIQPEWMKDEWKKRTLPKKFRNYGSNYYVAIMELLYRKILKGAVLKAAEDGKTKISVEHIRQSTPLAVSYVSDRPIHSAITFSKEEPIPLPIGKNPIKKENKKRKRRGRLPLPKK